MSEIGEFYVRVDKRDLFSASRVLGVDMGPLAHGEFTDDGEPGGYLCSEREAPVTRRAGGLQATKRDQAAAEGHEEWPIW